MQPDDPCVQCGAQLPTERSPKSHGRIYCSDKCQSRAVYERVMADPERSRRRRAYGRWYRMIDRCQNPRNSHWARYGGRGIYVCEEWHDFETYYSDTGDAPTGMTLDRIDNDGPYAPWNTRWATPKEQRANQEYDHMRIRTHCVNGHLFDAENTHVNHHGWRSCRACARAKTARQRAAKKGVAA